ncbi:Uncharacterised protein [Streptococcus pneumoniae]|nr:Uncharacterised protein [Streptococcus pneumoniae]
MSVHYHAVIDFIRKDNQIVLTGNLNNLQQEFLRIKGSSWVIWIDKDNCLGIGSDF